jgi:CheY-like chemotaxis protein
MARFLVVDDEPGNVDGLSRLLSADGHEVDSFTEGADAIEALSCGSYDAVMTDLEMPDVDGHTVVRVTRERNPHACVVVVTGKAAEHHERLVEAGACIVTDKPLDYEAVMQAIGECRSRGGPGLHRKCHVKSKGHGPLLPLRRR